VAAQRRRCATARPGGGGREGSARMAAQQGTNRDRRAGVREKGKGLSLYVVVRLYLVRK